MGGGGRYAGPALLMCRKSGLLSKAATRSNRALTAAGQVKTPFTAALIPALGQILYQCVLEVRNRQF